MHHKHHIVPKHMGGTNDPSNMELLTVAEHAERHKALYEQHGCWQDKIAWLTLSGQITSDQARRMAASHAMKNRTPEHKIAQYASVSRSNQTTQKREAARKVGLNRNIGEDDAFQAAGKEASYRIVTCHCGVSGAARTMKRWHFERCRK